MIYFHPLPPPSVAFFAFSPSFLFFQTFFWISIRSIVIFVNVIHFPSTSFFHVTPPQTYPFGRLGQNSLFSISLISSESSRSRNFSHILVIAPLLILLYPPPLYSIPSDPLPYCAGETKVYVCKWSWRVVCMHSQVFFLFHDYDSPLHAYRYRSI